MPVPEVDNPVRGRLGPDGDLDVRDAGQPLEDGLGWGLQIIDAAVKEASRQRGAAYERNDPERVNRWLYAEAALEALLTQDEAARWVGSWSRLTGYVHRGELRRLRGPDSRRAYRLGDHPWGVFSLSLLARTPEFRQAAA